jgi:hypothetical protein
MDSKSSKFYRKIKFPHKAKALIYAKRRACSNNIVGRSLQEKPKIIQVKYQEKCDVINIYRVSASLCVVQEFGRSKSKCRYRRWKLNMLEKK